MGIPEDLGKEEINIRGIYLGMYDKYMPTNQKCDSQVGILYVRGDIGI